VNLPVPFVPFDLVPGLRLDLGRVRVHAFGAAPCAWMSGTVFGVVTRGRVELTLPHPDGDDTFPLRAGAWFVVPGPGAVRGLSADAEGILIEDTGPVGLRAIGGPVEPAGRLRYIDGCTDTLLVCPPRLGEPSLNHLHIPAGTNQSPHTHASDRVGVILRGGGVCRTPDGITPLRPGLGWWIPAGSEHSFVTTDQALDVIAWHPDSVFGPTDEVHPMKSGTQLVVSGLAAEPPPR